MEAKNTVETAPPDHMENLNEFLDGKSFDEIFMADHNDACDNPYRTLKLNPECFASLSAVTKGYITYIDGFKFLSDENGVNTVYHDNFAMDFEDGMFVRARGSFARINRAPWSKPDSFAEALRDTLGL